MLLVARLYSNCLNVTGLDGAQKAEGSFDDEFGARVARSVDNQLEQLLVATSFVDGRRELCTGER
jgi:hypothetical protein